MAQLGTQYETLSRSPATEIALAALRHRVAGLRLMKTAIRLHDIACKAGFDPNQPRVPAGNPHGGRWAKPGGSSGTSSTGKPRRGTGKLKLPKRTPTSIPKLRIPVRGLGDNSGTELKPPPKVPTERPLTARARNKIVAELAEWLGKAAAKYLVPEIGLALDVIEGALWLREYYPYIQSSFDEPKSLDELRRAVSSPAEGYEIHHIVEQTPAEQDGFPRSQIDAPENLVLVPWLKHIKISAWYATRNKDFAGRPPRDFLRGKSWEEREAVGLEVLVKHGVLKRD